MKKGRKEKRGKKSKQGFICSIFVRYLILVLAALPGFWIFYFIFTPLTVYPVYFVLGLFFGASLFENIIFLGNPSYPIQIVNACIAGSAYYLLLIFNLSVPKIKINTRLKMVFFAFLSFLAVNVIRIILLSVVFILKPSIFDISHKLSWYFGSIILVIGIWFIEVKKFKINEVPFYSDIKSILKYIK